MDSFKRNDVAPHLKAIEKLNQLAAEKPRSELNSIASKILGAVSRPQQQAAKPQAARLLEGPKKSGTSSIAPDMTILGNVVCEEGNVQVLGCIKGELRIANLAIGVGGQVDGDVYALNLTIEGNVNGTIHANHVKLLGTSVVKGDIYHHSLKVEEDALFEGLSRRMDSEMGSVLMQAPQPPQPQLQQQQQAQPQPQPQAQPQQPYGARVASNGADARGPQTSSEGSLAVSAEPGPHGV